MVNDVTVHNEWFIIFSVVTLCRRIFEHKEKNLSTTKNVQVTQKFASFYLFCSTVSLQLAMAERMSTRRLNY